MHAKWEDFLNVVWASLWGWGKYFNATPKMQVCTLSRDAFILIWLIRQKNSGCEHLMWINSAKQALSFKAWYKIMKNGTASSLVFKRAGFQMWVTMGWTDVACKRTQFKGGCQKSSMTLHKFRLMNGREEGKASSSKMLLSPWLAALPAKKMSDAFHIISLYNVMRLSQECLMLLW